MDGRRFFLVAALGTVLLLAGCQTKVVTTNGAAPLYTVTASGTGQAVASPDVAEMYFGASVQSGDASEALSQASQQAEGITAAVKQAGVAADDIQTSNVSVYPEMGGDGMQITGYRSTVTVRVKVRDMEKIGEVIAAASDAGANEIGGPSFMLDDDAEASDEAIEAAIEDARRRAEVMAKASGKSLGEIISVAETGVTIPPLYYDSARSLAAEAAVPIEPGTLDVTSRVTVVFELK